MKNVTIWVGWISGILIILFQTFFLRNASGSFVDLIVQSIGSFSFLVLVAWGISALISKVKRTPGTNRFSFSVVFFSLSVFSLVGSLARAGLLSN